MSLEQNCPIIHVAAQHGHEAKQKNRMRELVESNTEEVVCRFDDSTGLRPFLLVVVGNHSDLSTIYRVLKMDLSKVQ